MTTPDNEPLFTKPAPETDGSESMTTLGEFALGLAFVAGAALVYVFWDSIALPEDSYAGGRRSGLRRLLGSIGQLPVTLVLAGIGVLVLALAIHGWLTRDDD